MYDAKDTFQMSVTSRNANSFKPEVELDNKYSMLLSLIMKNDTNQVAEFFKLFKNCHLTNNGPLDMDDGVKIVAITDEEGKPTSSNTLVRYGIFIRNNLPMWIIEIMLEVKMSFAYLFTDYDNVKIAKVSTEKQLNAWVETTKTFEYITSDDFVLSSIDAENLRSTIKSFDSTWELESENPFVIFKLVSFDDENDEIIISPQEHLARLLPFRYKISIDNFKTEVLNKNIDLYAVKID